MQQILDNLKLVTKNVAENKTVAQQKQKQNYDKNLKKRKVEDTEVGDQVLLYDNAKKRKKGASLKPVFKGPYGVRSVTSNSVKIKVNGSIENHHRRFCKKGKMTLFFNRRNFYQNIFSEVQFAKTNSARNKFPSTKINPREKKQSKLSTTSATNVLMKKKVSQEN